MTEILEMPTLDDVDLVDVMQALGDPVRLEIVRALAGGGEQPCGAVPLPVSASTRSHHFKVLRDAGLTVTRVVGTQRLVTLRTGEVDRRFPGLLDAILHSS